MPPVEEARRIFSRLGYTVSGEGAELLAERKWRTVHVTALTADQVDARRVLADGGRASEREYQFRCFVTWKEVTGNLRERLRAIGPRYEWAIIGVDESGEYEVVREDAPAPVPN